MAFVITAVTFKGGVGKTTTAVAVAEAASVGDDPAVLIDADPMGSAVRWSVLAAEAGQQFRATVIGMPAQDITRRIGRATAGAPVAVLDAPPPGALGIAKGAIEVADVVIMPVPPNGADLDRIPATYAVAVEHGVPAYAVLTMVRGGLDDRDAAVVALKSWGVRVLETQLPLAASVQRNYGRAPRGILARYGIDLLTEILDITKGEKRHG
jgi:chromosome partitioning protein